MSGKYRCVTYNRLLLLAIDIENVFGVNHTINKLYFHFNGNSIEGKFVKPYVIKFILTYNDEDTGENYTEEYKWSLEDIYDCLEYIPLYVLKGYPKTTYAVIDINDDVFPISNTKSISSLLPYEDISYTFEVKHGSVIINEALISEIERILTDNNIEYKVMSTDVDGKVDGKVDDQGLTATSATISSTTMKKYLIVYGPYDDTEPSYNIIISLDGKTYDKSGYCISPEPIEFKPYQSIGKFKLFSGKTVGVPNDEHLALITKCNMCEANIICAWLNFKGTKCPYCDTQIVL